MRDPNRLDNFYDEIKKLHMKYFPDWRFCQLMQNFMGWVFQERKADSFFLEEDRCLDWFKDFCNETN